MICPIFVKKHDKRKFPSLAQIIKDFSIRIQPFMSDQGKKRQRINDLLNAETKHKKIPK